MDRLDFGEDPGLVGPAGDDERVDLFLRFGVDLEPARPEAVEEPGLDLFRVPAGDFEQEPFQVGGDQDVHRGRRRPEKFAVSVVDAGLEKVRQDVVFVGGAEELADGKTHGPGIPGGQDVAEVSGRDADVDLVARFDLSLIHI